MLRIAPSNGLECHTYCFQDESSAYQAAQALQQEHPAICYMILPAEQPDGTTRLSNLTYQPETDPQKFSDQGR